MGTFDIILKGADILKEAGKIEEYKQILELMKENTKLVEEASMLRDENLVLREKLKNKEEVSKGINCYLDKDGTHYCMRCFDKHRILIRLIEHPGRPKMDCPDCKNIFNVTGRDEIAQQFIPRHNNYD